MKKIIAITTLVAATSASAFFGFFPLYSEGANERTRPEKLSGEVSCHPPLRATTGKTARHFKDNESYPPVIWKEPMHNGKIVKFFGAASTGLPGNNHQISGAHEN
jgi:hypothetical protein